MHFFWSRLLRTILCGAFITSRCFGLQGDSKLLLFEPPRLISSTHHVLQDLLARGLLPAGKAKQLGLSVQQPPDEVPEFGQDVVINNAPAPARYLLTKRTTQVSSIITDQRMKPWQARLSDTPCLTKLMDCVVPKLFFKFGTRLWSQSAHATCIANYILQEEIQRRTNTSIVNKGRYQTPGMAPDEKEKPLFLRVIPGSTLAVTAPQTSFGRLCAVM